MPEPREDNGPRTRLYSWYFQEPNIDKVLGTINAWGWADRVLSIEYRKSLDGFLCIFKLSQESYEQELALCGRPLPVEMQLEARVKELTDQVEDLKHQ